jgi:hypothetical protein
MRTAKKILISTAKAIAEQYGYDQVVIYARKVGLGGREHITTYGTTKEHCDIAALMSKKLQQLMGWKSE